jgi:hypothetical protein
MLKIPEPTPWAGEPIPGIYFLMLDGIAVYIGQSKNILTRVASHSYAQVKFDSVLHIPERRRGNRFAMEARLIIKHQPKLNVNGKTRGKYFGCRLPANLVKAVDRAAEKEGCTPDVIVSTALANHFRTFDAAIAKHGSPMAALLALSRAANQ